MATNLALNDRLIKQVLKVGKLTTKTQALNAALNEYVKHQKRMKLLEMAGTIDFRSDWDYKADRLRDLEDLSDAS